MMDFETHPVGTAARIEALVKERDDAYAYAKHLAEAAAQAGSAKAY